MTSRNADGRKPAKCRKCIEYFQRQKSRLELIHDLKRKNEGMMHASLKNEACDMIRKLGKENFPDDLTSVETEVSVRGIGKVDVLGRIGDATIAVECGKTTPRKILALEEHFDVVLHIPFCYTGDFMDINIDNVVHQLAVALIGKELERRGITGFEKSKFVCLEEGECSLPSGRDGCPQEAMEMAGLSLDQAREKTS